jgi:hypothetical protein
MDKLKIYEDAALEFLNACASFPNGFDPLDAYDLMFLAEKTAELESAIKPFHNWDWCVKCKKNNDLNKSPSQCAHCGADLFPF